MQIAVLVALSAWAITGVGTAYAQAVDPMKALQESRRESNALDKRLERAAAIQRQTEQAAEALRVRGDAALGERMPSLERPQAPTGPEIARDQVVLAVPMISTTLQPPTERSTMATPSSRGSVAIKVSKSAQRMSVVVDGQARYSWRVSTGRAGYETPKGSFSPMRLAREHYSREWDDAPMPYSIFFTGRGHAIHGSNDTRRLGRRASHGCIRLAPSNAAALFALVQAKGLSATKLTITN
jgi:lipoprotein-anchoring transpeptidase ErfK/SrfK